MYFLTPNIVSLLLITDHCKSSIIHQQQFWEWLRGLKGWGDPMHVSKHEYHLRATNLPVPPQWYHHSAIHHSGDMQYGLHTWQTWLFWHKSKHDKCPPLGGDHVQKGLESSCITDIISLRGQWHLPFLEYIFMYTTCTWILRAFRGNLAADKDSTIALLHSIQHTTQCKDCLIQFEKPVFLSIQDLWLFSPQRKERCYFQAINTSYRRLPYYTPI